MDKPIIDSVVKFRFAKKGGIFDGYEGSGKVYQINSSGYYIDTGQTKLFLSPEEIIDVELPPIPLPPEGGFKNADSI